MFLVIGILFFLAWLASYFVLYIGHIFTYAFLIIAIILIILHFVMMFRRRGQGKSEI